MFNDESVIGTAAIKKIESDKCELKSLYLLEKYCGKRLGYHLLETAILQAKQDNYKFMFLDTLSSSKRAFSLYEKMGFSRIER